MRYTVVFEFSDGEEPAVGKKDTWLGGDLCAVQFSDVLEELEKLQNDMEILREMWERNSLGDRGQRYEVTYHGEDVNETTDSRN